MAKIITARLIMRDWSDSDRVPWAVMNADPAVRQYLGPVLTFEQASAWVVSYQDDLERYGFGFWALEVRASGEFIGFAGLQTLDEMPFAGVELGWRLARTAWGHGFAAEAALATLAYGFGVLKLPEIVAITAAGNVRSRSVMRRIGMTRDPADDFDDPDVDADALRPQVVYRRRRNPDCADDRHERVAPTAAWDHEVQAAALSSQRPSRPARH